MILKNNIGIFQGRLSDSMQLQKFPEDWKKELFIAKCLSFSYVEFFLEEKINNNNPFWSKKSRNEIKYLIKKNFNSKNFLLCDNYIIKNNLYKYKTCLYLIKILKILREFDSSVLVLPINSLYFNDISKLSIFFKKLFKNKSKKIQILFEVDTDAKKIINFLNLLENNECGITFDIGNIYLKNYSIINFFKSIKKFVKHIHIKDRNKNGDNVKLGTGLINFKSFFHFLKNQNYNYFITLETFRKNNAVIAGFENLQFIKSLT